jgi:CxxC motif-containing protein
MEKIEMICINCPLGCALTVERDGDNFKVSGNTCPRGAKYAVNELTHPVRTLTTTVAVANREGAYLPVKTAKPISKSKLFEAMALVNSTKAVAPIKIGDIIIENMLGEADLVAASDVE